MLETTNMSAAEFAERLAESAKIIKYTFRMEIPKEEQDLQDNLVACSLDQAYRMAKPLFLDRWKNHPFLRNPEFKQESNQQVKSESGSEAKLNSDQQAKLNSDHQAKQEERKKSFKEEGEKILCDAAVAELYCIIRKIIGEENLLTTYAASEYAFFDPKAFGTEQVDILSNFATGMDDLINRKIYRFDNTQPLTFEKETLKTEILGKKKSSRNQSLKTTTNNVDAKLTAFLPGYRSFFQEENKEKNDSSISSQNQKTILKSSDLDLMVILKRSAKKLDILRTIQEARQDHTTLSMLQIQKLQRLHKELTSFCEQRYDDKDQKKHLTTVELEHLTAADKLYIQMEIERITNCTMLADLLKNIRELPGARSDVMFADPASIILFSRCFELGNIYNRTEVLDRSFQGFQDSLMRKKELMMETLELGVQRSLKDMNIDTIDVSYFERWKKVYEEEMDCWSNWIFPIFTSCFCVVLSKNIKEEQSNLKKNDAKEVSIMYKELSDYINKNNLKMSAMTFDDELLSNARKNSIMRNMISDYLMDALQEKRRLPIPITLKEVNEIMPKRSVGKGLKEARI